MCCSMYRAREWRSKPIQNSKSLSFMREAKIDISRPRAPAASHVSTGSPIASTSLARSSSECSAFDRVEGLRTMTYDFLDAHHILAQFRFMYWQRAPQALDCLILIVGLNFVGAP